MQITFTIPSNKIDRITEAFVSLYPIPKIPDQDGNMVNEFSDNEWAKECIRQYTIDQVKRWEDFRDKKLVNNVRDETLIE